jgi:AraC family transcriptional regulator
MIESPLLQTGQYSGAVVSLRNLDGLIAGTTVYEKDSFNQEFHYHENPHLTFILQGGNIENRKGKSRNLEVGDVVFYHSGEWHQTLPAAELSKNINLEIEGSFLKTFNISENALNNAVGDNPDSKFLLLRIHRELQTNDDLMAASIQMLLLSVIDHSNQLSNYKPEWIIRLTELLRDQWNQSHSLMDLSLLLQIHPVTISRYFSKYFGCTLGEYARKIKIEKSIPLIKNGQYTLTEIALECGFFDQSHFTRNFKALTGLLPKEFQRL